MLKRLLWSDLQQFLHQHLTSTIDTKEIMWTT